MMDLCNFSSGEGPLFQKSKTQRAGSPELSCVSLKSSDSMFHPPDLSIGGSGTEKRLMKSRAESPELSCVSLKSNNSMFHPPDLSIGGSDTDPRLMKSRAESPELSCVSLKSNNSMFHPPDLSIGGSDTEKRAKSPELSCVSLKSNNSMFHPPDLSIGGSDTDQRCVKEKKRNICKTTLDHIFKELQQNFISIVKNELNTFKKLLSPDYPECPERDMDDQKVGREGLLKITLKILRNMKQDDLANTLESILAPASHRKIKSKLKEKYQNINEGISGHGNSALLNEIYTELYITEGGGGEVNQEHEVKQIEAASRKKITEEVLIKCSDIFKPLPEQNRAIRTALTKGVAGIGKTVSVQKFILDWAEGEVNQDILFIFPLPFRELNLMKEMKVSLMNLLHRFFPETQDLKARHYERYKILFIFDGLDECRLPLDFQNNQILTNIEEQTSVDVLLTNLIKGNLLPSALLWITSRPAASSQIPPECVDQVTEVRGFNAQQKQEYFRKRIRDQGLANKVISHIRSSRSLYIMCHIPVFCWIAATVLERMLSEAESEEIPKTLTQMFTYFLLFQIKHKSQKYGFESDADQTRESILALGKLAFQQLEKGNLIFYEEDLKESGIDITEVSVYSGVCTQIFREEEKLHLGKVFCFVHLSVQEFLAALYAFLNKKLPNQQFTEKQTSILSRLFSRSPTAVFLNSAVDQALQSESGHLDLFLRFLLGLSLESNQTLLQCILTERSSHSSEETIEYIKEKIEENSSPERSINLFHCLNELNDHSLVQEVQKYLSRDDSHLVQTGLSPAQWSALAFVLLNSEEELDEFDLSKCDPSEECLLRLLPVIKASRRSLLASCNLSVKACETLGSVLKLENSLKELDLSNNDLRSSGVELLSAGLKSSHCKLETLRMTSCNLGEKVGETLGSVLHLDNSLKELDLSNNDVQDSGVELLSAGLRSSHCKLETLRLALCNLGEKGGENLGSVLKLENSSLKELDLSNNDLQDSGVELLSAGLKSSHCKLETLRLSGCMVTEEGCCSLAAALSSNPSHIKEINLTYNHPGEAGVKLLSAILEDPHCKLETLRVEHGGEIRIKPGLKKYACDLTLDPNTAHKQLSLSEGNRKVLCGEKLQFLQYPNHPERFDEPFQVMSRESLTGRCYWEAESSGWGGATLALTYKTISRKGNSSDCWFGEQKKSWTLNCSDYSYSVHHNINSTDLCLPPFPNCRRVGVYVDCQAGTLSFYSISSDTHTLTHLHTFSTTFTQPLYAGFRLWDEDSSVRFCEIE